MIKNLKNIINKLLKIKNFPKNITQIKNTLYYKRVYNEEPPYTVCEQIQSVVSACEIHKKTFDDLRYLYYGRNVAVCATGPTFDFYSPIKDTVHIGVNCAYKSDKVLFDGLFCIDVHGFGGKLPKDFMTYRDSECIKFLGYGTPLSLDVNPKTCNIKYFSTENKFNYLINYLPLPDFTSVIFSAFSYALWTAPKRIYIVGADCSCGYANSLNVDYNNSLIHLISHWENMKKFADRYYPDIEIISINPVGLKGLFRDVYTKEYVEAHPESFERTSNIEIINEMGVITNETI